MQELGILVDFPTMTVSADGRVIVGYSYNGISSEYFAWTASGSSSLTATFVAPRVNSPTTLGFMLMVTDEDGVQASDQIVVTVTRR